jgi:protein phosphatase
MVKENRIAEILATAGGLDSAASQLVAEANEAGGRDNITVVAFRLAEAEEPAPTEDATLIGPSAEEAGLTGAAVGAATTEAEPTTARPPRARRPRPAAPPPRRRLRTALKVGLAVLIVAGICAGAVLGARQIYFLGTDEGGRLALYRGLPYDLPLDISLYSEVTSSPTQVDSLPEDRRDEATNHELRGKDDATSLLEDLEAAAVPAEPTPPRRDGGQQRKRGDRQQQGDGRNRNR